MQLEVQHLRKTFGQRTVVKDVSLHVAGGEVVGLLGANGAGKTTCFSMIVGLVKPDSGSITLRGQDISQFPMFERARTGLSYLPQEASVFRPLSVEDNLRMIWQVTGVSEEEQDELLEELLTDLNLHKVRHSLGIELSGGERRRVEIARCLAGKPEYILLDEPFSGVDPLAVAEIQEIVAQLKTKGMGILITDHNVRETLAITDRAYIIREGEILVEGDAVTITESPLARKYYLGDKYQTGFEKTTTSS